MRCSRTCIAATVALTIFTNINLRAHKDPKSSEPQTKIVLAYTHSGMKIINGVQETKTHFHINWKPVTNPQNFINSGVVIKTEDYKTDKNKEIIIKTTHTENFTRNSLGTLWERTNTSEITQAHKNIALDQPRREILGEDLSKYEQQRRDNQLAKIGHDIIGDSVRVEEIALRPMFRREELNGAPGEEFDRYWEMFIQQIRGNERDFQINRMNVLPITDPKLMH